jgi:hypothetical protein
MLDPSTARELIKNHMPVVCSNGRQFATVDHLDDNDTIKLTRDESGSHHFIPLAWVTMVDDKVHIDRPGKQAMEEWTTESNDVDAEAVTEAIRAEARPAGQPKSNGAHGAAQPAPEATTTTDETRGQPLAARVQSRVAELQAAVEGLGEETIERREIELALATAESLTTGDLSHPSDVVAMRLSEWLERNKYLAMKAAPGDVTAPEAPAKKAKKAQ